MGDHPRRWAVCSLGNLAIGSEDQAKGLGLLTDLQSLRWHGSRFKAKHQPPEYKAGNQNRNWGNGVSETQTHSLTLGYGRGLVKWKQASLHTWNGHKIRIRLTGHWTWEPLAYWFSVPSSLQSPKDRGLVPGLWQRANLQVRAKWLNPAVEIVNLQGLVAKKIITRSNHVSQNISFYLGILGCNSTETKRMENWNKKTAKCLEIFVYWMSGTLIFRNYIKEIFGIPSYFCAPIKCWQS